MFYKKYFFIWKYDGGVKKSYDGTATMFLRNVDSIFHAVRRSRASFSDE